MLNPFAHLSVTQNLEKTPLEYARGDKFNKRVIEICRQAKRNIALSVESGTIPQAERSLAHLRRLL